MTDDTDGDDLTLLQLLEVSEIPKLDLHFETTGAVFSASAEDMLHLSDFHQVLNGGGWWSLCIY